MNKAIERVFVLLHQLRDAPEVCLIFWELNGFIQGLYWVDVIDYDQFKALSALASNALIHSHAPFPTMLNAGPCISRFELNKRNVATHLLEKPQAQVQANEKPEPVSAPAAPRKLLLLCLLGKVPGPVTRFFPPIAVHRLPAPWLSPRGRWCVRLSNSSARRLPLFGIWPVQGLPGLYLRETHAVAPSSEVLARLQRHGQASAFCATARTLRTGVTG